MRRATLTILTAVLFVMAAFSFAQAQIYTAFAYEAVTIDNTAGGVGLTAATYLNAVVADCVLETANIRFDVTASVVVSDTLGAPLTSGQTLQLYKEEIAKFKGSRTTGTSGKLHCFYKK